MKEIIIMECETDDDLKKYWWRQSLSLKKKIMKL